VMTPHTRYGLLWAD